MRKGRLTLVIVSAGLLACGAYFLFSPFRVPSYQGKSLDYWIDQFYADFQQNRRQNIHHDFCWHDLDTPAALAIRQIGSNGIPHLLHVIAYDPPAWKHTLKDRINTILQEFNSPRLLDDEEDREREHSIAAMVAFGVLSTNALSAASQLRGLFKSGDNPRTFRATYALALIQDWEPLLAALTNKDERLQHSGLYGLRFVRQKARPILPAILQCVEDPATAIALHAVEVLSSDAVDADIVVPAFTASLTNPAVAVRAAVANGLGNYRTNALSAVSALVRLTTDPDPEVRKAITNALNKITPPKSQDCCPD